MAVFAHMVVTLVIEVLSKICPDGHVTWITTPTPESVELTTCENVSGRHVFAVVQS